jgi:hypothetical protein
MKVLIFNLYKAGVTVLHKVLSDIISMVVYTLKKCGETNFLTPHGFRNISDFGVEYEKCETINMIHGELKKQV